MENDVPKGNPSSQPIADPEPDKSKLETDKLKLELLNYAKRLELEDKKLRLDIRDWYFRAITFFLAGIASFFGGMIVQHYREKSDQAFQMQQATKRAEEENFSKNLALLSASDPGQRADAAAALEIYVISAPVANTGSQPGENEAEKQRKEREVAKVVSTRMITEPDITALQSYSELLQTIGRPALPYVVDLDARAAAHFADAAGDYVASHLKNPERFQGDCESDVRQNREDVSDLQHDVSLLIARTADPPFSPPFQSDQMLQAPGFINRYFFHCRLILDNRQDQSTAEQKSQRVESLSAVVKDAHILAASSFTLSKILNSLSRHLAGEKLDGAVLVSKNLDETDISGATLKGSYIDGPAKDFTCNGCDFSNAILASFYPYGAWSLKGSRFTGAQLSDVIQASIGRNKK
jgi:hypothetical protein